MAITVFFVTFKCLQKSGLNLSITPKKLFLSRNRIVSSAAEFLSADSAGKSCQELATVSGPVKGALRALPDEEADGEDVEKDAKTAHQHHQHTLHQVRELLQQQTNRMYLKGLSREMDLPFDDMYG